MAVLVPERDGGPVGCRDGYVQGSRYRGMTEGAIGGIRAVCML